jgi:hypothetical protein
MYIPEEVIWFGLGFIAFPIFAYALYEFVLKKKLDNTEEDRR